MEIGKLVKKVKDNLGRYKYILLILLLGIILMLASGNYEENNTSENECSDSLIQDIGVQLSEILRNISGVGEVQVLLTVNQGEKIIYQTDTDLNESEDASDNRSQTVTITDSDRNQTGLIQQINPPTYKGAIVICQGADAPAVRLAVVEAVSKVTGLGANQICVLKMK